MKTLEKHIDSLIPKTWNSVSVIAFELWGNARDGYDCNSAWYLSKDADRDELLEIARGRWEVFKANYAPRGRVCDIADISCSEETAMLEVDCVPFLTIEKK